MFNQKSNKAILEELDKVVYGHASAKKALINVVARSKLRYYQRHGLQLPDEHLLSSQNIVLIGDSGTGKTFLVQQLSKICEFPLLNIDATTLAPTSATGTSSAALLKMIKAKALEYHQNFPLIYRSFEGTLDQMVVFVDEFDKLATAFNGNGDGNWNRHTQANFLTMFENNAELAGVSFIFAGAFTGLPKETKDKRIGFTSQTTVKQIDLEQEIVKFGIIPELLGRISYIEQLDELEIKDYVNILNTIIIPKRLEDLSAYGISSSVFDDIDLNQVAKAAKSSGLGIRNLIKQIQKISAELEFDYENQEDMKYLGYSQLDTGDYDDYEFTAANE